MCTIVKFPTVPKQEQREECMLNFILTVNKTFYPGAVFGYQVTGVGVSAVSRWESRCR